MRTQDEDSFSWHQFLTIAYDLTDEKQCISFRCVKESRLRSAVSRAYYAAFHHAYAYAVIKHGLSPQFKLTQKDKESIHQKLIDRYRDKDVNRDDIADSLRDLRDFRNNCDYNNKVDQLFIQYKDALILAEELIRDLN